jgi:6-pyruvoyltetrahydropterin/6-carboxytetrahydropterin synthase
MMFEVGIQTQFEAAHTLRGEFGPATRRHGHTYTVEVTVKGSRLRQDGTLLDISLLQRLVKEAIDPLHYRDLDDLDAFRDRNSTAEMVALYLWEQIGPALTGEAIDSLVVQVAESPQAFARYEAPLRANSE